MFLRKLLLAPMCTTRFLLGLSSLTWAGVLFTTCHLFTGRTTYDIMAAIANENVWGTLFAVHGIVALFTLILDIRNKISLYFDGLLGCVVWTAATAACFAAHWPSADSWFTALTLYKPPAAMSADIWVATAAWWHLIKHWAEDER